MKKRHFFQILLFVLLLSACTTEKYEVKQKTDKNGFTYEYVTNDPVKARIYTLENGLKVYLTDNKDEPRIYTAIAVRAGSASDPVETTGLAHYFEHMMFKGTDDIGTLDWEKEKPLLDEISNLFEQHRDTQDPETKKQIYFKIDSVSALAARFAVANDYDKLAASIGAKGTNAGTNYDMTVFINDIPSNELEKWAKLESERFTDMVLRIFHTELETVYEEFNMYQDDDNVRADEVLMSKMFGDHPYGRSIIGLPEHLKNPSLVNIYHFAETYYVPNNMAIVLSGDLDFEETIQIVDAHFGDVEPGDLPEQVRPEAPVIDQPIVDTVTGPSAENLILAFRFNGMNSEDYKYVTLIDMILSNSQAGLIDLNLVQEQKVLSAGCYPYFLADYGAHYFYGTPRESQTLEEVQDLLLAEVEKIKSGEFEDWIIEAVINDLKLSEMRQQESNYARVFNYVDGFVKDVDYVNLVSFLDDLEEIDKTKITEFAQNHYNKNYVLVYKKTGENDNLVKVEKPQITSVPINREDQSDFYKEFITDQPEPIEPVFVDFEEEITSRKLVSGIDISYIENKTNDIFTLQYILDMGKNHNIKLPLAVNYLPYLGTDDYSAADLQKEWFKLGLNMGVYAGDERSYIYITGLEKSFEKGVELLEHVLSNVEPDQKAYEDYVDGILKSRADAKLNKNSILWGGLFNYGMYGQQSPFTHLIPEEELLNIDPGELTDLLKDLIEYKHRIFLYGEIELSDARVILDRFHIIPAILNEYPEPVCFEEKETGENQVYFVDYDMVQANILFLTKDTRLNPELIPMAQLFNEYFGSNIIFQEIRESRALAYSAFATFSTPSKPDKSHYVYSYVGTQADKLKTATDAMLDLMNNMPKAQKQFDLARETIMKRIETERITKTNIYNTYQINKDRGIEYDIRKDVYETMQTVTLEELEDFANNHVSGKHYNFLVLGSRDMIDMDVLKNLGPVKELTLGELFGY